MSDLVRLYLSPFDADRLPVVLAPSIRTDAVDITFHTIPTFPEKNFGYVTLPRDISERLKKKFHGCILKGQKMKVQEARPKSLANISASEERTKDPDSTKPPVLSAKKTRSTDSKSNQDGEITGVELPKGRKVKRGWTGADDAETPRTKGKQKRSKEKSKSLSGRDECLFRATVASPSVGDGHEALHKGKKRKGAAGSVVQEFQNAKGVASPPREEGVSARSEATERYIDDKGWIDKNGNVVEKARRRRPSHGKAVLPSIVTLEEPVVTGTPLTTHSPADPGTGKRQTRSNRKKAATEGDTVLNADNEDDSLQAASVERLSISRSSGSPTPHTDTQPTSAPASSSGIHPLEALFKRPKAAASQSQTPKKPHLELSTSFNFFDSAPEEVSTSEAGVLLPQTPFTQQDFRHRRQRSAAPTPDTALPGKTFADIIGGREEDGMESDIEEEDGQVTGGADGVEASEEGGVDGGQASQESSFAKEFWEKRREGNRDWKRRKREATKAKRLRERREKK